MIIFVISLRSVMKADFMKIGYFLFVVKYGFIFLSVQGVPGVGKEQALKLIETLQGQNLLQR